MKELDAERDETSRLGRYRLEVIDVYQQPERLDGDRIVAVPTLVRALPGPVRRLVGDLTRPERILVGLELQTAPPPGR